MEVFSLFVLDQLILFTYCDICWEKIYPQGVRIYPDLNTIKTKFSLAVESCGGIGQRTDVVIPRSTTKSDAEFCLFRKAV